MDLLSNLTAFSGVALSLMGGGGVNITILHKSSVDRYVSMYFKEIEFITIR